MIAQFVPQATIVPVDIFLPFSAGKTLTASSTSGGGTGGGGGGGGTGGSSSLSGTSNALTSSDLLYNGLQYVVQHPFVNDPLRPGKVDRIIAASFAFGINADVRDRSGRLQATIPQVVIALKNAYHKFLQGGDRADRGFGSVRRTAGRRSPDDLQLDDGRNRRQTRFPRARTTLTTARVGDVNGMSLPAVLNEVISVTGVYLVPI